MDGKWGKWMSSIKFRPAADFRAGLPIGGAKPWTQPSHYPHFAGCLYIYIYMYIYIHTYQQAFCAWIYQASAGPLWRTRWLAPCPEALRLARQTLASGPQAPWRSIRQHSIVLWRRSFLKPFLLPLLTSPWQLLTISSWPVKKWL